jgi:hypothetical protein
MTIQAWVLVNSSNSNYTIPADNVELKNTAAHVVWWNCPIDQWTTSWTSIWSMPATILWKTYSTNQACKVQADTVSLRVTTLSWQAVWQYSWELTITYSNFDDTIDCRSAVDPNCQRPDTIINYWWASMRRAWCNSTLGSGVGVAASFNDGIVYGCSRSSVLTPQPRMYSSTWIEINLFSWCKISNIFGKHYAWWAEWSQYWTDLACWFWWHLSTNSERKILEELYGMQLWINTIGWTWYIENYLNDWYSVNHFRWTNQWWYWTYFWLLTFDLWFPLAGISDTLQSKISGRWVAWNYRTQTPSFHFNDPRVRTFNVWYRWVERSYAITGNYLSVRCVRNSSCSSDFVCKTWEWCEEDASCCNHDIKFTTWWNDYTRAWCNSTLWDMQNNTAIYDYTWYAISCNPTSNQFPYYWFNLKEIWMWWTCKIKNNFGKLYQRDNQNSEWLRYNCKNSAWNAFDWTTNNYNCPCPNWRHVPTTTEWNFAKDYYTSIWWTNWWAGNQSWLTRKFQLPLVWWCTSSFPPVCISRWYAAHYRSSNENWWQWEAQIIWYSLSNMSNASRAKIDYLPVRCIKD